VSDSVTSRALALLGAFDGEHRNLSLTDLARRAGIPLATAHRLVGELHRWGALAREPGGDYVIVARVAARVADNTQLRETFARTLERAGALPASAAPGTMPPAKKPDPSLSRNTSKPDVSAG
jgi:DNA-binding IclR family transcriptional regulator